MHIVIAIALLVMLFSQIGKKSNTVQPTAAKRSKEDLDWIDELEIFDTVMDDFI